MVLPVVQFGHPVLRQKGDRIEKISTEITQLIADMLETMHAARGIGLAAQQIGRALQLAVIDVRGISDRPSTLDWNDEPADVEAFMPLVLINPVVTPAGEPATASEGCLSFPEMYAKIARPEAVSVSALDAQGKRVNFRCGGLLARAVQHETDHLNGILFIDRMTRADKDELRAELDELQAVTKAELKRKK